MFDPDELEFHLASNAEWNIFLKKNSGLLSGSDFSGLTFDGIEFIGLDLENCDFSGAIFRDCKFRRANVYGANFSESIFENCQVTGCILTNANLIQSEFSFCDFAGSEFTNSASSEAAFENCDLSRSRGLSQKFLDEAIGDGATQIPQLLDYPDHWVMLESDRERSVWIKKLSSLRGDSVILCAFDGDYLENLGFNDRISGDQKSVLRSLQRQLGYAVEDKLLHNEYHKIFRALCDYHEVLTSPAGDGNPRWPKKESELDHIQVGIEGSNLLSLIKSCENEISGSGGENWGLLQNIVHGHVMLVSSLSRWKGFLQAVSEAKMTDDQSIAVKETSSNVIDFLEMREVEIDREIPQTMRALRSLLDSPIEQSKAVTYAIVQCLESIFSAIFSFCKKFIGAVGDEIVESGSKKVAGTLTIGLIAVGASQLVSLFPHLDIWLQGGLNALRHLAIIP